MIYILYVYILYICTRKVVKLTLVRLEVFIVKSDQVQNQDTNE